MGSYGQKAFAYFNEDFSLHPVQAFPHHDAVAPDDNHAYLVLLCRRDNLHCIVQDDVHELIVATEHADDVAVRVQLQVKPLLHELPQVCSSSCLRCHCCKEKLTQRQLKMGS